MRISFRFRSAVISLLCAGLLLTGNSSFAQDEQVDVRLVIDVSGSMKQNDPNNLRQPAVGLLLELLPEDSTAGVWTFGKWVNMLIPHKTVDDNWRQSAAAEANAINSVGLFTNIGEALEKAAYDQAYTDANDKKHIILLTDGMVDIDQDSSQNKVEWRRIVDEVLPKLKAAGYVIHTIALSNNADRDLMNRLSVGTDGVADVAETADDLMKIFLKAFDAAVPAEQVALANNSFVIDSSVEEFTALFFRANAADKTQLVSPDEQVWDETTRNADLKWYRTEYYDLVTVKRPLEGSWGVVGELDPQSRVTVVSNLNLRMRPLPNNVLRGAELTLDVFLQEDGKTIVNPDFLSLMDVKAELHGGRTFDALVSLWSEALGRTSAVEGRYIGQMPALDKEGVYEVRVVVDGKTFTRSIKQQITLRQAFGAEVREQFEEGVLNYVLTVNAFKNEVDYASTQVVASIVTPSGQRSVRPIPLSELDIWKTSITPSAEGKYLVNVQVKGTLVDGTAFKYDLDELTFNYSADAGMVADEPPFVEEKPEVEEAEPEAREEQEDTAEEAPAPAEAKANKASSKWALYAALGVGNLLLLALGYFAFRKIMGGPKNDVLAELEEAEQETIEQETTGEETAVAAEQEAAAQVEDDEEEEPPMEDLDPDAGSSEAELFTEDAQPEQPEIVEEPESQMQAPPEQEPVQAEVEEEPQEEVAPAMEAEDALADLGFDDVDFAEDESEGEDTAAEAIDLEGIDDLDAMALAMNESSDDDASDGGDEEEDMVEAMLKAQGLDLAEEELDDAISSLIDDLEDDDEKKA